jgi:serine/threonine protein kinase
MSRLLHSNLSRIFEVGNAKGRMFYTQQLAEGMSLRRIIDERVLKGSLFSCKELEPIVVQLVHALEAVHEKGAHLNVKPGNIFVLPDSLRLTDAGLGLAIPREPFVQAHRMRRDESYFAPEFLSGAQVGAGADVYSLGVIMGELLAGILPDGGVPSLSENNPDIPEELEAIYRKAIAANPLARYRSVAEFHADFSAFFEKHTHFYEKHAQKAEKKPSLGVLIPLQAQQGNFPADEAVSDSLTPRVPSGDLSHVELRDLLPKRTVRNIQWMIIALGALVVIGILIALMGSEPEEMTGRNVEGFVQTTPAAPTTKTRKKDEKVVPPEPPRGFHSEEVAPSRPSFHSEEVREDSPL